VITVEGHDLNPRILSQPTTPPPGTVGRSLTSILK
jgi:hypothetical protein